MITNKHFWTTGFLLLITFFLCLSCTTDSNEAEWDLNGKWRVTRVESDRPNPPYIEGDTFIFYKNASMNRYNTFETWGEDDFHEEGTWYIQGDSWSGYQLIMAFGNGYHADIVADMDVRSGADIIYLTVDDSQWGGRYYLTLMRW